MKMYDLEKRIWLRSDLTSKLIHLTRPKDERNAFENLIKILCDKKLLASDDRGTIPGNIPCVCFQETPVENLAETLVAELYFQDNQHQYKGYGIRVDKTKIFKSGGRPVIYDANDEIVNQIDQKWRLSTMNYQSSSYNVDWSHEREWRLPYDFCFEYSDIDIIVTSVNKRKELINWCERNDRLEIVFECRSIFVLEGLAE